MASPRLRAVLAFGLVAACGGGGGGGGSLPSSSQDDRPPSSFEAPPSRYESPGSGDQDPSGNGGAGSCAPCNEQLACSYQVGSNTYRSVVELRTYAGACIVTESGSGVAYGAELACDGTLVNPSSGTLEGSWARSSSAGLSFCLQSGNQGGACAECSFVTPIDGGGPDAFPAPLPPEPGGGGQPGGFSVGDGGAVD